MTKNEVDECIDEQPARISNKEVQFPKAYIKFKWKHVLFSTLLRFAGKIQDGLYCETGQIR